MPSSRESKSVRNFGMIIYPDADNYDCSFSLNAVQFFFSEWAYILHDKDTDVDGNLKKPHYHVLCRKSTPSTISVVANQLKIPANYVQPVSNWRSALLYLTHAGLTEKYQYSVNDVVSNLPDKYFTNAEATAFSAYRAITNLISSGEVHNLTQLNNWCIENGYWSEFRRNWSLFNALLHEQGYFGFSTNLHARANAELDHTSFVGSFSDVADVLDTFEEQLTINENL